MSDTLNFAKVESILSEADKAMDNAEFTRAVIDQFGGYQGIADYLKRVSDAATDGGSVQASVARFLTEMVKYQAAQETRRKTDLIDDEELEMTCRPYLIIALRKLIAGTGIPYDLLTQVEKYLSQALSDISILNAKRQDTEKRVSAI